MAKGPSAFLSGDTKGRVRGLDALLANIAKLPNQLVQDLQTPLDEAADLVVADLKKAAPVSDLEDHAGQLRDSIRKEADRSPLARRIVVDAKDAKGASYPAHVEYGHKTRSGAHVPAEPFFHPTIRADRPKVAAKIGRGVRDATARLSGTGS